MATVEGRFSNFVGFEGGADFLMGNCPCVPLIWLDLPRNGLILVLGILAFEPFAFREWFIDFSPRRRVGFGGELVPSQCLCGFLDFGKRDKWGFVTGRNVGFSQCLQGLARGYGTGRFAHAI